MFYILITLLFGDSQEERENCDGVKNQRELHYELTELNVDDLGHLSCIREESSTWVDLGHLSCVRESSTWVDLGHLSCVRESSTWVDLGHLSKYVI